MNFLYLLFLIIFKCETRLLHFGTGILQASSYGQNSNTTYLRFVRGNNVAFHLHIRSLLLHETWLDLAGTLEQYESNHSLQSENKGNYLKNYVDREGWVMRNVNESQLISMLHCVQLF